MQFTSLAYLGFFAAVFAVHWAVPQKARWAVCLAASAGFYALLGAPMLAVLALCIAVSYLGGLWLQRRRGRRPALALAAAALLCPAVSAANLDEIEKYFITVRIQPDGSAEIDYDIHWKVLDSTTAGPLEWVKVGVPNNNIEPVSHSAKKIPALKFCIATKSSCSPWCCR